jgi:hypothetical protein
MGNFLSNLSKAFKDQDNNSRLNSQKQKVKRVDLILIALYAVI